MTHHEIFSTNAQKAMTCIRLRLSRTRYANTHRSRQAGRQASNQTRRAHPIPSLLYYPTLAQVRHKSDRSRFSSRSNPKKSRRRKAHSVSPPYPTPSSIRYHKPGTRRRVQPTPWSRTKKRWNEANNCDMQAAQTAEKRSFQKKPPSARIRWKRV